MANDEARQTASGFCYINAGITGLSGLVSLIKGPRLAGLAKLAGAGTHTWAGLDPTPERLQISAGVSAGLGVLDLLNVFRSDLGKGQRMFRLSGAAFNALMAVLHNEAAKDV